MAAKNANMRWHVLLQKTGCVNIIRWTEYFEAGRPNCSGTDFHHRSQKRRLCQFQKRPCQKNDFPIAHECFVQSMRGICLKSACKSIFRIAFPSLWSRAWTTNQSVLVTPKSTILNVSPYMRSTSPYLSIFLENNAHWTPTPMGSFKKVPIKRSILIKCIIVPLKLHAVTCYKNALVEMFQ